MRGGRARCRALGCGLCAAALAGPGVAQQPSLLAPWAPEAATAPAAPWQPLGLPGQQAPATRFSLVEADGRRVLQVEARGSYGNLVQALADGPAGAAPPAAAAARWLSWRWRLLLPNPAADLRRRSGDDAALKVCALFDLPLAQVPFAERQLLRLARARSGEPLPAATLCYVWDARLAAGTALDNAYTRRLRWLVLRGPADGPQPWADEQRDLHADLRRAFGDELGDGPLPPLRAIAVGADADNSGGHSLGQIDALQLR